MEKITFKDLPSTDTPINSTNLNLLQTNTEDAINEVLNLVYPIGRGFIDFTNTDYSNYLGFTWERELVGMFPVGYNENDTDFSVINKTGGSKFLQNHKHFVMSGEPSTSGNIMFPAYSAKGVSTVNTESKGYGANTTYEGEGDSGNLPPYKVVAYWKRTA